MFFPIGDDQVKGGFRPYVSYGFIVINVAIFALQYTQPGALICEFAAIPDNIISGNSTFTLITSMFMHGSVMHLVGNMLFLWVFADNIEATIGSFKFIIFYLLGGFAASAAHIYFSLGPDLAGCCAPCIQECAQTATVCAGTVPSLGASGAIAAVLGAYLVMFPKSKVKVLVLIFFTAFSVPAFLFLGIWIAQQLISGIAALGPMASSGGVAWWAHIGGFVFGVLVGGILRFWGRKAHVVSSRKKGGGGLV
ncbi:MAG: rhomboid family intramembrane serine protease [Saprospiraceae bacterium]|nr:rhomboid family intramembrane serine protease [Saprospiraceae bacterium]